MHYLSSDRRARAEEDYTAKLGATSHYRSLVHKSKTADDSDSNWLITFTDVLSLLLVFLIVMVVMTKDTAKAKGHQALEQIPAPAATASQNVASGEMREKVDRMIRDLSMEGDVSVQAINKGLVITMKERVTFRPGDAEILSGSLPLLDAIAAVIKEHPSFAIEIDGHSDDIPIRSARYPSNWELSFARALSVMKHLTVAHGLDPARFSVRGNADTKPIDSNDTPEERARNRRVEIQLKELDV